MPSTLDIALQNQTSSSTVYAYITGRAINNDSALFLLQSDGTTAYYPSSPSSTGSALSQQIAIPLGSPGATFTVTIPQLAGARIWFSVDTPLVFLLNPGPALVEPSVTNPTDPNINTSWSFCELTFNPSQVFANISYVDFVSLPISLDLASTDGATQHVSGLPQSGLDTICAGLGAQRAADGQGWDSLVVSSGGRNLRALSPYNGIMMNSSLFSGYYDNYVNQVWSKYTNTALSVDTQASFGTVSGTISSNSLNLGGIMFAAPSTADIFGCNTGPFATGPDAETNAIIPRLAAAFNRSTILNTSTLPAPPPYYTNDITNHYARIVHATNLDGRGYAFAYDDVTPSGGADQAGTVSSGNPQLLTVAVGGAGAYST